MNYRIRLAKISVGITMVMIIESAYGKLLPEKSKTDLFTKVNLVHYMKLFAVTVLMIKKKFALGGF